MLEDSHLHTHRLVEEEHHLHIRHLAEEEEHHLRIHRPAEEDSLDHEEDPADILHTVEAVEPDHIPLVGHRTEGAEVPGHNPAVRRSLPEEHPEEHRRNHPAAVEEALHQPCSASRPWCRSLDR